MAEKAGPKDTMLWYLEQWLECLQDPSIVYDESLSWRVSTQASSINYFSTILRVKL